jgi:hypothetical protein
MRSLTSHDSFLELLDTVVREVNEKRYGQPENRERDGVSSAQMRLVP